MVNRNQLAVVIFCIAVLLFIVACSSTMCASNSEIMDFMDGTADAMECW